MKIIKINMRFLLLVLVVLFLFIVIGCHKPDSSNHLELSFLNNEIVSYSKNSDKDSINIIYYSLKNNSNETYFINNLTEQNKLSKTAVYKNGINLHIYNNKNEEIKYNVKRYWNKDLRTESAIGFMVENFSINEERLKNKYNSKYFGLYERNNLFFIHPNEIIFFKYVVNLNRPISFDGVREGYASLNQGQKYYSKLSIASDSLNYKYVLPGDILKTIKENNVKVYHGIIESKNKVSIKVLD